MVPFLAIFLGLLEEEFPMLLSRKRIYQKKFPKKAFLEADFFVISEGSRYLTAKLFLTRPEYRLLITIGIT